MKWLILFLFLFTIVNAEELTTGNLITSCLKRGVRSIFAILFDDEFLD